MTDTALHCEASGHGEALVLWHGWGMNLRVFEPLVSHLARHFRVIAVDLPGHGHSAWPGAMPFEATLPSLLATLPEHCTLLGWSLGALLALQAAQLAPQRIRRLVLLHATPKFVADASWTHGLKPAVLQGFATALQRDYQRTIADFLELQVRGSQDPAASLRQLRLTLQEHGLARPEALAAGLELLRTADLRPMLAAVATPTLVLGGQHDRVTPPAAGQALAALLPDASYGEFSRAGHAAFLSHTAAVAASITAWLGAPPVQSA